MTELVEHGLSAVVTSDSSMCWLSPAEVEAFRVSGVLPARQDAISVPSKPGFQDLISVGRVLTRVDRPGYWGRA